MTTDAFCEKDSMGYDHFTHRHICHSTRNLKTLLDGVQHEIEHRAPLVQPLGVVDNRPIDDSLGGLVD